LNLAGGKKLFNGLFHPGSPPALNLPHISAPFPPIHKGPPYGTQEIRSSIDTGYTTAIPV
jgi:hypothetical protein